MRFLTGLILGAALFSSVNAKELGDLHNDIEANFPGKIVGLSGAKGSISRVDWSGSASAQDKTSIQNYIQNYNLKN